MSDRNRDRVKVWYIVDQLERVREWYRVGFEWSVIALGFSRLPTCEELVV